MVAALRLFYSYSTEDEKFHSRLDQHLKLLVRSGVIEPWSARDVKAGIEFDEQIRDNLNQADIILLLISANFIASDSCYDVEMKRALERHEQGAARVIPILLNPVDWKRTPFGKLKPLPQNQKPVSLWENEEEAWHEIATEIRRIANEIQHHKNGTPIPPPSNPSLETVPVPPASRAAAASLPSPAVTLRRPLSAYISVALACGLALLAGMLIFRSDSQPPTQNEAVKPDPTVAPTPAPVSPSASTSTSGVVKPPAPYPAEEQIQAPEVTAEPSILELCNSACSKLFPTENLFAPCLVTCKEFGSASCLRKETAGSSVRGNELAQCLFKPHCRPAGSQGCVPVYDCELRCLTNRQGPDCLCQCMATADPRQTLNLVSINLCLAANCVNFVDNIPEYARCMIEHCTPQSSQCSY